MVGSLHFNLDAIVVDGWSSSVKGLCYRTAESIPLPRRQWKPFIDPDENMLEAVFVTGIIRAKP